MFCLDVRSRKAEDFITCSVVDECPRTSPGHFSRSPAVNAGSTAVEWEIPCLSCCSLTRSKLSQEEMGAWPFDLLGRAISWEGHWAIRKLGDHQ